MASAAEITGTIGPDINSQSGLSGNVNIDGNALYPDEHTCVLDSDCNSQHCAADYDGDGNWCAAATSCAHDGTISTDGTKTCYGIYKEVCTSGSWIATLCSSCSGGECSGGTTCGNSSCESGETCSSCAADCGACSTPCTNCGGGGGGGGGGGTATPTPTATPVPTATPQTTTEIILEETQPYSPTQEQVDETLVDAGITAPEEIAKITEQMGNLSIEKTLEVEKTTDTGTGEESFESTITIKITNIGGSSFQDGTAYELIPKSLVSDPSLISSDLPFTIGERDGFWVIKWNYDLLGPGKTAGFSYRLPFSLGNEILKNSKSLFSGEKKAVSPEELLGKVIVKVLFNGAPQQGIIVSLVKDEVKIAQGTTNNGGLVEFSSLSAGAYVVSTQATDQFNAANIAVGLTVGATKTAEIQLSAKAVGPGTETFELPWLFILLILAVLVLLAVFLFRDKIFGGKEAVGLAAAAKKVDASGKGEAKRPFQKAKEAREATVAAAVKPEPKPAKDEHKTYKCDECGEEFHTRIALHAHKRRHQHTR
ncbi:MAG: hypothetical protein V1493_04925 [Candidatus Diapherotrites archaeon]